MCSSVPGTAAATTGTRVHRTAASPALLGSPTHLVGRAPILTLSSAGCGLRQLLDELFLDLAALWVRGRLLRPGVSHKHVTPCKLSLYLLTKLRIKEVGYAV